MEPLLRLAHWLRADRWSRGVALASGVSGVALVLCQTVFHRQIEETLSGSAHALLDGGLFALLVGGLVFLLARGAQRMGVEADDATRVNEERFRQLTTLSADWFWETDAEHRISWMSGGPTVVALFGGQRTYGRHLWEIEGIEIAPDELAGHREQLERRLPFYDLEVARRGEGRIRQMHVVSGQPRFSQDGAFAGYRGVGRDVTEKRSAERALAEAKERLELALEGSDASLWDTDLRTGEVYLSEAWAEMLGEPRAPTRSSVSALMARVHPEDLDHALRVSVETMKGLREGYAEEHRVRTAAGDWMWVLSRGKVAERDPATGRALRMTGTNVDITARKRAEQALRDAETRYRSLIELAPDGVIVHSGGVIEYANAAAARLFRAGTAKRLIGLSIADLVHPDEVARLQERMRYLEAGPGTMRFEERRLRCLDGSEALAETAGVSYLERGRLVMQSVVRDVSEQRRAREAIAERERRFRDVVAAAGEYVWETDAAWRYTYLSERVEAVLGYMPAEMVGRTPRDFMPLGEGRTVDQWFAQHAAEDKAFRGLEHRAIAKSGGVIWQSVSGVPVRNAQGQPAGYRGTGADITARKQAEARVQFLATRDAITGLPNRALLGDRANQAILAAARSRGQLALLAFDLDGFKLVNDSLGYQAGDALLRAVAERLSSTLRRDDTLARLGGDEFALLWNGLKSSADAALVAQRILDVLARPFTIESRTLGVSASIGIAVYPDDGRDFVELLKNADAAMHHAKDTGRAGLRYFSPALNARAVARLAMENDLRGALARGEIVLHYQPVVRCGPSGGLVGAEVLARWQHPRDGLLMPDAFIPVAEESGLIRALGEWTLERAFSRIGAWRRSLAPDLWFSLNVSARELAQGEAYVAKLERALSANGIPGEAIELEVTERVLMSHLGENVETLKRIGDLGVRIAIDDFGTGYSSLAYLRQLPIDKLKIDRSFLGELEANPDDATIVQAIAAMARTLGLHVAVEGVENGAQLARLAALGCDEWQGHHCSPPLEAGAFEVLLSRRAAAAG